MTTSEWEKKMTLGGGYQAFQILRFTFTLAPIIAGLDKFFHYLVDWGQYLSSTFDVLTQYGDHATITTVGIIEILVGIGVAWKPQYFAYIVFLWLVAIIVNLGFLNEYYDIAFRDAAIALSALALARLSHQYSH